MNFNQFTIKAQEAVQEAVNLTQARGQQAIEPVHLLQSVMKVGENVTNFIFQKLGMNGQQIALVLDKQIDSLPKVSGGEPYLSRETNEIFQERQPNIPKKWARVRFTGTDVARFAHCKKYRFHHPERCRNDGERLAQCNQ